MKRTKARLVLIAFGTLFVWIACGEMPTMDDAPEYDNPYNPDDPGYVSPGIRIVSAPQGVVDTTSVRLSWEGVPDTLDYQYKYRFDGGDWSRWAIDDTTAVFDYLEDDHHSFEVISRFPDGTDSSAIADTTFIVQALPLKSLYFYPYLTKASAGDTITLELWAKELTGLIAIEFTLQYDRSALVPLDTIPGTFLTDAGGQIIIFSERNPYWNFNLGAVNGDQGWIPGSGTVISFRFEVVNSINSSIELTNLDARGSSDEDLNKDASITIRGAFIGQ